VAVAVDAQALVQQRKELAVQAVQALLLFLTQAHKKAQAAQSLLWAATLFTHLQLAAHIRLEDNHGTFCKSSRR
jgi:hypothetical protein